MLLWGTRLVFSCLAVLIISRWSILLYFFQNNLMFNLIFLLKWFLLFSCRTTVESFFSVWAWSDHRKLSVNSGRRITDCGLFTLFSFAVFGKRTDLCSIYYCGFSATMYELMENQCQVVSWLMVFHFHVTTCHDWHMADYLLLNSSGFWILASVS